MVSIKRSNAAGSCCLATVPPTPSTPTRAHCFPILERRGPVVRQAVDLVANRFPLSVFIAVQACLLRASARVCLCGEGGDSFSRRLRPQLACGSPSFFPFSYLGVPVIEGSSRSQSAWLMSIRTAIGRMPTLLLLSGHAREDNTLC